MIFAVKSIQWFVFVKTIFFEAETYFQILRRRSLDLKISVTVIRLRTELIVETLNLYFCLTFFQGKKLISRSHKM